MEFRTTDGRNPSKDMRCAAQERIVLDAVSRKLVLAVFKFNKHCKPWRTARPNILILTDAVPSCTLAANGWACPLPRNAQFQTTAELSAAGALS